MALKKVPTEVARNPLLFAPPLHPPAQVGACAAVKVPVRKVPESDGIRRSRRH